LTRTKNNDIILDKEVDRVILLNVKIDGEYKPIQVQEYELKALIATGKFVQLGGQYYHVDHITKFFKSEKPEPNNKKPEPPQIMIKRG